MPRLASHRAHLHLAELEGRFVPSAAVSSPPEMEPVPPATTALGYGPVPGTSPAGEGTVSLSPAPPPSETPFADVGPAPGGTAPLEPVPDGGDGLHLPVVPPGYGGRPPAVLPANLAPAPGVNDDGPLSPTDAIILKGYLEHLGGGGKLSDPQARELEILVKRFKEDGLEIEGLQRMEELQELIDAMGKITDKLGVNRVPDHLDYVSDMLEQMLNMLKLVKEREYEKFKQQMGENSSLDQARKRYDIIKDGLVAEFVQEHWLRYQLEVLKKQIDGLKKPR